MNIGLPKSGKLPRSYTAMTYPILPDKYKLAPLLTAESMIEFRRKYGGLGDLPAPRSVVLCLYKGAINRFAWKYPSRRVRGFLGDVYLLKRTGDSVAVLGNFGIGASGTTSLADELMAWGVQNLVIMSLAGGLQLTSHPAASWSSIAPSAMRAHPITTLPPARDVQASPPLVSEIASALEKHGMRPATGAVWSTDAPYRETHRKPTSLEEKASKPWTWKAPASSPLRKREAGRLPPCSS